MVYDNSAVRRQDRLLDERRAMELLQNGEYGVLSMASEDGGYGIPVSYVYDGASAIYIHCAPEGRKLKAIAQQPKISFCVVGRTNVIPSKFTTAYESIVLQGKATTGLTEDERMHALQLIVEKYSPDYKEIGMKYAEKSFQRTEIIKIDITSASGKAKKVTQ